MSHPSCLPPPFTAVPYLHALDMHSRIRQEMKADGEEEVRQIAFETTQAALVILDRVVNILRLDR